MLNRSDCIKKECPDGIDLVAPEIVLKSVEMDNEHDPQRVLLTFEKDKEKVIRYIVAPDLFAAIEEYAKNHYLIIERRNIS